MVSRQVRRVAGRQVEGVVGEVETPDDGVVELLHAVVVDAHVVRRPPGPELLADGRQLAHELAQLRVVRAAARLGAEQRDRHVGRAVPVRVVVERPRVEELEPGEVRRPPAGCRTAVSAAPTPGCWSRRCPAGGWRRRRRSPSSSPASTAPAAGSGLGCGAGERGSAERRGPGRTGSVRSASSSCRARATASSTSSETPEMWPFSSRVYQSVLTPARTATSSRRRPGHPTAAAAGQQPGLLGRDPGAAAGEEVADVGAVVHPIDATSPRR